VRGDNCGCKKLVRRGEENRKHGGDGWFAARRTRGEECQDLEKLPPATGLVSSLDLPAEMNCMS
jgi:hypothetical protein